MSHTPFRRVRAKRVLEVADSPDQLDFDDVRDTAEEERSTSPLQRGLAALAISTLGLVGVGGVLAAASPHSDRVDTSAVSTDRSTSDITRAVPAPDALTIEQQVQARVSQARAVSGQHDSGLLAAFAGNTTVTRSAARTELSTQVAAQGAVARQGQINEVNKKVRNEATDLGASSRDDQIAADLARVKKEAAVIAAEKKKAEALLKAGKKAEAAKAEQDASAATPATTTVDTSGLSAQGATTPIAKGQYSVGASWGEYGSWARWHTGQDFPAPVGTPIRAVADGVASVDCGGCQGWAGDSVLILHHADGSSTLYAHMDRYTVQPGTVVKAGTVIGYVGLKGRTFGPHLHFEYYPKGTTPGDVYSSKNPVTFLLSLGVHV